MDPGQKRKKPPACDACKARRVLCHPSPSGCPRCIEKGVACTTTPVVRKKRAATRASSPTRSVASTPAPVASTSTLPAQSPVPPTAPLPYYDPLSTYQAALPIPPALPLALLPHPSSSTTLSIRGSDALWHAQPVKITPELAQHLFFSLKQSTTYDHPVFGSVDLEELFASLPSYWTPELLPPSQKVLVYCVLAVGARLAFAPAIIGTSGPLPQSFVELNEAVLRGSVDLREFGRRRAQTCGSLCALAEKLAKENDVAFEASRENAASAILLDSMVTMPDASVSLGTPKPSRFWLAAFHSHLRTLEDEGDIETDHARWAAHMAADQVAEIDSGRLTRTTTDVLTFAGDVGPGPAVLDKLVKEELEKPVSPDFIWPHVRSLCRLYLDIGHALTDDILGVHARRSPLDHTALSEFMLVLGHVRSISRGIIDLIDGVSAKAGKGVETDWLFPHALPRPGRYTLALSRAGVRNLVVFLWGSLVFPLYRELQRRFGTLEVTPDDFAARQAADRINLSLSHTREFLLAALEQKAESLACNPSFSLSITMKSADLLKWAVVLIEEIDAGRWHLDQRVASICERFSISLKLAGYVNSTPAIDSVIEKLEAHLLTFQLTQPPANSSSSYAGTASAFVPQFQLLASPEDSPPFVTGPSSSSFAPAASGSFSSSSATPFAPASYATSSHHSSFSSSSGRAATTATAFLEPSAAGVGDTLSAQLTALEEELEMSGALGRGGRGRAGRASEEEAGTAGDAMAGLEGFEDELGGLASSAFGMTGWDWTQ